MFQDITIEECSALRNRRELVLIDVRSPSEYNEASIPGSLNIPIFDDQERAEIGTLYKQVSVQAAKERGLEIVSAKLPTFIKTFANISENKAVFCWRGGMRSKTTATVLSLMGIRVYRISGGYRAYRQYVVEQLKEIRFEPQTFVIHGNTGSGKTTILRKMKQNGHSVLDLEGLAGHRGSIFGAIGLKANNQKTFDSLLLDDLLAYEQSPYVLFEAESRRIGNITVPDLMADLRTKGHHISLELPLEARVNQIIEDYKPWENIDECMRSFRIIKSRIHTPVAAEIEACLMSEKYHSAVELLLTYYYDPKYSYSSNEHDEQVSSIVTAASTDDAMIKIEQIVNTVMESKSIPQ
ncbi:tRNA 2-selenouridine(34) synthase MnmH [Paenibacillus sp. PL91]|uniref:tRNA 2-selenouridine(34) synthase MnmH n=1 Tax=Paenibacillus sp. PL91 TaxID=2729538 RepID=UPI00145F6434|nr:tRNA 2-selenouridine(34) synthase MnmH [Paenibacillus sp. PL91]MBC9200108.1 tRNA 2-selenouridine(34) synthase MnmH [Paenibacillus sp. PL91]